MSTPSQTPVVQATLPSPSCTCARLRKLSRQMTLVYDQKLEPYGLTVSQFSLIAHLRSLDEGVGIGALANILVMDPTSLTRTLRPLERAGFVSITALESDKRARRVRLTPGGNAAYRAARVGWSAAQDHVDQVLRARDVPGLNTLLDQLIEEMKAEPLPEAPAGALEAKDSP